MRINSYLEISLPYGYSIKTEVNEAGQQVLMIECGQKTTASGDKTPELRIQITPMSVRVDDSMRNLHGAFRAAAIGKSAGFSMGASIEAGTRTISKSVGFGFYILCIWVEDNTQGYYLFASNGDVAGTEDETLGFFAAHVSTVLNAITINGKGGGFSPLTKEFLKQTFARGIDGLTPKQLDGGGRGTDCADQSVDASRNTSDHLNEEQKKELRRLEEYKENKTLAEKVRAEQIAYRSDYARWENERDAQEARRKAELEERLEAERERIALDAKQRSDMRKQEQETLIAAKTKEIEEAEAALTKIGVFRFAEKKAQKQTVAALIQELETAKKEKERTETAFRKELDEIPLRIKEKEPVLRKEIEEKYPIPHEPEKPAFMTADAAKPTAEVNEVIEQMILEILSDGEAHRASELMEEPVLCEFSSTRILAILKRMRDHGEIDRKEINHLAYYSLR